MTNGHDKADDTTPPVTARRDAGATFIELLVSIILLGTVGVAVLVAVAATIVGARTHDAVAENQLQLAEAADVMTDTDPEAVPYVECGAGPSAAYQAVIDSLFPPAGSIGVSVAYWDANANAGDGAFGTNCLFPNHRLQEVRLSTLVDGVTRSVTVIKRPPDVPTASTLPADTVPPYNGGAGSATVSPTPGING